MKVKPLVIFILGGPGSGKGTQCSLIRDRFKFIHLSAGDLLREQRSNPQSKDGQLIQQYIVEGKIVPSSITVRLLQKAMLKNGWSQSRFLIDGFPRNIQNLSNWNNLMSQKVNIPFIANMKCNQNVLKERLLKRAQTSGRSDDNQKTIKKRFQTYNQQTIQVVNHYKEKSQLVQANAHNPIQHIFSQLKQQFNKRGIFQ